MPEENSESYQKQFLKSTIEVIKARARYIKNLDEFYKWSIAAGLTGLLGGLGAIVFNFFLSTSITGFQKLITILPDPRLIAVIPAIGGLLVGIIRFYLYPEAFESGSGVDTMIDIIHDNNGQSKIRVPFVSIATSALTIGSGGSVGREGPAILIGTGFGSIAARIIQLLRLDKLLGFEFTKADLRTLAICGAAAGLGAIFRAPIGGALFASSILYIYGMEIDTLLPSLISSITAFLVFSLAYGFESPFGAPFIWSFNFFDLLIVVVIGIVASLVGVIYIKFFQAVFQGFRKLAIPDYVKPAIGGLATGLFVLVVPRVWGMGYETIQNAINYELAISTLFVLIFAKIIATSFSIGSGGAGGDMIPSLFIGAAVGGILGSVAMQLFPNNAVHPALYVIAGMGALYSSVAKVPLATAILLSETTRNFSWIVPLITANIVSFLASSGRTIYESQHADASAEKQDFLRHVKVNTIMDKDIVSVSPDISINHLISMVRITEHHGYPVLKNERLVGVVSWHDTRKIPMEKRDTLTVADIMTKEVLSVTPESRVKKALTLLDKHKVGRIIVTDPKDKSKVVGLITRRNIIEAYTRITESK